MKSTFPTEITFHRTSNVFLNTGIVALYDYLLDAALEFSDLAIDFSPDALTVRGDGWREALEEVYYRMGKEIYEHSTEDGNIKYYFTREPFTQTPFKTKNSYGLSGMITKPPLGPQPVPRKEENAAYIADLFEAEPEFAQNIAQFYCSKGLALKGFDMVEKDGEVSLLPNKKQVKGDSRIFLNEEYTKIPSVSFDEKYFLKGDKICALTGEGFQKLCEVKNTSPFMKSLTNFNSFLTPDSAASISWKAMFVSRFSPKYCFYHYSRDLKTFFCYLFETNSLENLRSLLQRHRTIFMDSIELHQAKYITNFKIFNFPGKKGDEQKSAPKISFTEQHEMRFMLVYTIYHNLLFSKNIESATEIDLEALDAALDFKQLPLTLASFRADEFSGTLRPNYFEQFNHFKFTIRLIARLEKQGINFQSLLQSLLFQHRSERSSKNSYRLERQFRNAVLDKVMKAQSVLPDFENLFFWCFLYLNSPDETDQKEARRKNFRTLFDFLTFYEPILYKKMEKEALTSLQTRAVNLGKSIGMSALNFENGDRRANAKQARSYMVHLHKARTAEQFREAIIRFQKKYGIIVANQLLESEDMNDDQNFVFIKQFTVMAALNILNGALQPNSSNTSTNQPAS